MKKLNKLEINTNKLITDEKLISLKGGYDGTSIKCYSEGWMTGCMGYLGTVQGDCGNWQSECMAAGYKAYCAEC